MSTGIWRPHPLHAVILELLEKKGALEDGELLDLVKGEYGEVRFKALNKALMMLEIHGKVYVSSLGRRKRRVELVKKRE
ncbi:MAG: ArsR family transcriptional regulator [Thermoproteota archaeon]|nr:ArsR family transcriptional regulator [Thermoproteota archaeon]